MTRQPPAGWSRRQPAAPPLAVHVVYEHGADGRPFGSASARLLRPLSHPSLAGRVTATFGRDYGGQPVDVVVVDRLWRPDVSAAHVERLLASARKAGARVVHALDDNFLDLVRERPDWATADQVAALDALLAGADGLVVTTGPLADRFLERSRRVVVLPNALDERLIREGRRRRRLLAWRRPLQALRRALTGPGGPRPSGRGRPLAIGYMGTYTHGPDLALVAPALRAARAAHGDGVRFEVVGVVPERGPLDELGEGWVRAVPPTPDLADYPVFVPWFIATFRWDVALSPLVDTPFSRGKSDIKLLDYAALGAAGLYSRHPAYAATVRDGETGLLVEEDPAAWTAALERLLADRRLRRHIAAGAWRYLWSERTLARTARRWPEAIATAAGLADGADGGGDGGTDDGMAAR